MPERAVTGPEKPRRGEPCNGCGFCCVAEVCGVGKLAGITEAPCSALMWRDGRFACAFVEVEEKGGLEPIFRNALGIGKGCDADD